MTNKTEESKKYGLSVQEADNQTYFTTFSSDVRLELKSNALAIGKCLISFQKLKKVNGSKKQEALIPIYVSINKIAELIMDYKNGNLAKKYLADAAAEEKAVKAGQKYYPKALWKTFGGTGAKKLAAQGKSRADGKAEYREISLVRGQKAPWLLIAMVCAGVEDDKGLIMPAKNGNQIVDAKRIMIPLSSSDMKAIILLTEIEIAAYRTAQYNKGIIIDIVDELANTINNKTVDVGTAVVKKIGEAVKAVKGQTDVAPVSANEPPKEELVAETDKLKKEVVDEVVEIDSLDPDELPFY